MDMGGGEICKAAVIWTCSYVATSYSWPSGPLLSSTFWAPQIFCTPDHTTSEVHFARQGLKPQNYRRSAATECIRNTMSIGC